MATINDIILESLDLCDANTTSYPATTMLRRINEAYERVVGWILAIDGTWQWDDTNYTDLPIGTQTLVEGQNNYSFNDKFLEIEEVLILDEAGKWHIIKPIDQSELEINIPLEEYFADNGRPLYYDKVTDDTIKLYPAPDDGSSVTLANGIKIKFRRTADIFTTAQVTAGTKIPGFISSAHYILSYMAAIPYCMKYKKDRVSLYEKRVGDFDPPIGYKKEIIDSYSRREQDKRKVLTMEGVLHR